MKSFYKSMTLQEFGRKALAGLGFSVEAPASLAGLEGHRRSVRMRLSETCVRGCEFIETCVSRFSDLGFGARRVDGA